MNTKAQISQVFTYVIIILVVGLIVIFGYKGIQSIMSTNCEQQRISFETNLFGYIEEYVDKGSVHEESLRAPCDARMICFLDSNYCPRAGSERPTLSLADNLNGDNVVKSNADNCTANIFVKSDFTKPLAYSKKVSLEGDAFQCFRAKDGRFDLLFKGLGRKTLITPT